MRTDIENGFNETIKLSFKNKEILMVFYFLNCLTIENFYMHMCARMHMGHQDGSRIEYRARH